MFRRTKGWTEGLQPWGIILPLGAKFTHGGKISSLGFKLKTGLWGSEYYVRLASVMW
jgi:hypothetical protein